MVTPPAPVGTALGRRDLVGAVTSPLGLASLALPLVVAGAWAVGTRRGAEPLLGATAIRIWAALLGTAVALAALRAASRRRWHVAVGWAGALAILLQVPVSLGWRFRGACDAGEGEAEPRWRDVHAGAFGLPPALQVVEIAPIEGGAARVRVGTEVAMLRPGERRTLSGASVRLVGFGPAPSFALTTASGEVVEDGLLKLSPDDHGFVQLGQLPHRLHLRLPEGLAGIEAPEVLNVRVERGKLLVVERALHRLEPLAFEGLVFRWGDGARWARIEVTSAPRPLLAGLGAVLLVEALGAAVLRRRRS